MRLENLGRPCRFATLVFGFDCLQTRKAREEDMDFFSNFADVEVEVLSCRYSCLRLKFASSVSDNRII